MCWDSAKDQIKLNTTHKLKHIISIGMCGVFSEESSLVASIHNQFRYVDTLRGVTSTHQSVLFIWDASSPEAECYITTINKSQTGSPEPSMDWKSFFTFPGSTLSVRWAGMVAWIWHKQQKRSWTMLGLGLFWTTAGGICGWLDTETVITRRTTILPCGEWVIFPPYQPWKSIKS